MKRETDAWYSGYAAYFRELNDSVTSKLAPGGTKRQVRKSGPTIVQLMNRSQPSVAGSVAPTVNK